MEVREKQKKGKGIITMNDNLKNKTKQKNNCPVFVPLSSEFNQGNKANGEEYSE